MPTYAEWVATAALVLSSISLVWQVVRTRRDQPIVIVGGQWAVSQAAKDGWERYWFLPIDVTNAGGRPVTITYLGWQITREDGGFFRISSEEVNSEMPIRLEALAANSWLVQVPVQGTRWDGLTARPVVDVVLHRGITTVYGRPATLRELRASPHGIESSEP